MFNIEKASLLYSFEEKIHRIFTFSLSLFVYRVNEGFRQVRQAGSGRQVQAGKSSLKRRFLVSRCGKCTEKCHNDVKKGCLFGFISYHLLDG